MKKNIFLILIFYLSFISFLKASTNLPLKDYIEKNDIENGSTQIYLLSRCSAIYAYASALILKTDTENSKKFIEIANNLLFKSVELRVIHSKEKSEEAKKKAEAERKILFKNYKVEGKKNWNKNKSYFKGSYISEDMSICEKLIKDK